MEEFLKTKHELMLENEHLLAFRKLIHINIYEIDQRTKNVSFISPSILTKELNKCTRNKKTSKNLQNILSVSNNCTRNIVVIINKIMRYAALQPLFRKHYSKLFIDWYKECKTKHEILNALNLFLSLLHFNQNSSDTEENEYLSFCSSQKKKNLVIGSYTFVCILMKNGLSECEQIIDNFIVNELISRKNENYVEILCGIMKEMPFKYIKKYLPAIKNLNEYLKKEKQTRKRLLLLNAIDDIKGYKNSDTIFK